MNTHEKRRLRDKKRTIEHLRNKFIAKYVEGMHGDIYVEAQELYEDVKRKNPGRKDLTKTIEFMNAVTPHRPIPAYYFVKQRKRSQKTRETTRSTSTTTMPRMVLNIPLMPLVSTSSDVGEQPPSPPHISTSSDVEEQPPSPHISTSSDVGEQPPSPPHISTSSDVGEQPPSPPHISTSSDVGEQTPQLEIPSGVYTQLLEDLRKDPDLWQILNDFNTDIGEIGYDHDDTRNDMWDSFENQTPLERELELQGY